MRGQGQSERKQLVREAERLVRVVTDMTSDYPLRPVFGGLPSFVSGIGRFEPTSSAEEHQIFALREPLTHFLKAAERHFNNCATSSERARFQENGLVKVAFQGHHAERRQYHKSDCIADLRSTIALLRGMGAGEQGKKRISLAEQLRTTRESAGHSQEEAAGRIGIDPKAYGEYERGVRQPRGENRANGVSTSLR
jgi:DNA-binding XRE family transcriptional regulator